MGIGEMLQVISVLALAIVGALLGAVFIAFIVGIIIATIRTIREERKK